MIANADIYRGMSANSFLAELAANIREVRTRLQPHIKEAVVQLRSKRARLNIEFIFMMTLPTMVITVALSFGHAPHAIIWAVAFAWMLTYLRHFAIRIQDIELDDYGNEHSATVSNLDDRRNAG